MRVQVKIIILLISLVLIFAIMFLMHYAINQRTVYLLLKQDEQEKNAIFDKILNLRGRSLEVFAFDYTSWDEMLSFVNDYKNKREWAVQNIDSGLSVFNANAVWIFNLDGDLAYSISNFKDAALKEFPLAKEAIKKTVYARRFCHFFINTEQGIEEIRGSTIHPTFDLERKTEPKGYFFCARLWDKDFLAELSHLTGGVLKIVPSFQKIPFASSNDVKEGIINISRVLNGPDDRPIMRIDASFKSQGVMLLNDQAEQYIFLFWVFAFLVFTLLVIFITRWISIPLSLISKTLTSEDLSYLDTLQKATSEFGKISQLIHKSFEQKASLVKGIDERRKTEDALRDSEERFKQVAENAGEWIWEINAEGLYIYSNPIVEKILGYTPEEIIGKKHFYDFFAADVKEKLKKTAFAAFADRGTFKCLINPNLHKNGSTVILETNGTPVIDAKGNLRGYRGVDRDITERKQAEEELRRAYEQLKQTQAQLVQSAKMASIGQLAGGVAHEINNPLTGVLNNVQLIRIIQEQKKDFNAADFKELLDVIEESALRCKRITQSLLDFSRASKGLLQPVSLNEVVEKVIVIIEYEMKLRNISVHKELKPDIPLVLGNFQLLQQVVFDIISNARWAIEKKAQKTDGTISIRTGFTAEDKQAYISISDNGIGIPKDDLDKVFEPFFTTKSIGEGTGLGLSIAYSIIKEHKGTIEVNSEENKGAIFRISLPSYNFIEGRCNG